MEPKRTLVVVHRIDCRCPVETFVGKAVDCFGHAACQCLLGCEQVTQPHTPIEDHLGGRPDWA